MIGSTILLLVPGSALARSPRAEPACHARHGHSHTCQAGARGHRVRGRHAQPRVRHIRPRVRHAQPRVRHVEPKVRPQRVPASHHRPLRSTPAEASVPVQSPSAQIAAVLSTQCANTEVTPEPGNLALVRSAVLCLVNRVRAEHGEAPLVANADLERAAEEHSQELVADDYFAHVSPSGETPVQRIEATGYVPGPSSGYVLGENLAWGTLNLATPQQIVEAWIASPGHLANILESQYKDTGIGVTSAVPPSLADGEAGATYAQEFGVILG
ncbi:MAG TPA: CAP domain-containing protein [Solirubrobacteraceae bacterium]|nr:CAP domain-containing protein [Solirubrobacteraceae bacterium]